VKYKGISVLVWFGTSYKTNYILKLKITQVLCVYVKIVASKEETIQQ